MHGDLDAASKRHVIASNSLRFGKMLDRSIRYEDLRVGDMHIVVVEQFQALMCGSLNAQKSKQPKCTVVFVTAASCQCRKCRPTRTADLSLLEGHQE